MQRILHPIALTAIEAHHRSLNGVLGESSVYGLPTFTELTPDQSALRIEITVPIPQPLHCRVAPVQDLVNQGYTDIQFQSVGIYATKWILHVPMPSEVAA